MENIKVDSEILVQLLGWAKEVTPEEIILEVRIEQVLKGMGMQLSDADPYLLDLINGFISKCKGLVSPRAAYVLYDNVRFDRTSYTTLISALELHTGKIVTSFLKKSKAVILFSCTCGDEVEKLSKSYIRDGHGLEGFIVDLIGSELAESITEFMHNYIENTVASAGYGVTNRFSPGYCNWPVSDQQLLFSLLKGNNCGIELTPTSLMLPIKSVSGIIGIGHSLIRTDYKCRICKDENCMMREK